MERNAKIDSFFISSDFLIAHVAPRKAGSPIVSRPGPRLSNGRSLEKSEKGHKCPLRLGEIPADHPCRTGFFSTAGQSSPPARFTVAFPFFPESIHKASCLGVSSPPQRVARRALPPGPDPRTSAGSANASSTGP